jgi:hypothetical protein
MRTDTVYRGWLDPYIVLNLCVSECIRNTLTFCLIIRMAKPQSIFLRLWNVLKIGNVIIRACDAYQRPHPPVVRIGD